MSNTTFLEPANRQIRTFDENTVFEHAKSDIAQLLKTAQAKLPEHEASHRIIHLLKIETDAAYLDKILELYRTAAGQENQRLKEQSIPIHIEITNGGHGEIYFAVANYEPIQKPQLPTPCTLNLQGVSKEDYLQLVTGMGLTAEDEEQLTMLIPEIYKKAQEGRVDLANVAISRGENGLRIEEKKAIVMAPELALSEETCRKLLMLIGKRMQQIPEREKQDTPRAQLLGDAIIYICRDLTSPQSAVGGIKTPQELASVMLEYAEKKSKGEKVQPPTANCAEYSLLVNELLKREEYQSSIISIHAINADGEEMKGHAVAAVVANGWLIDPALKTEAIKIDGMTLDKNSPDYTKFYKKMEGHYLNELNSAALEFGQDTKNSELKAFYLLEAGVLLKRQGIDANAYFLEASRLNPKNFYTSYLTASASEDKEVAIALYRQCADLNPDLYLANEYAAQGLLNIAIETNSSELLKEAYAYSKKALGMQPDSFFPAFRHIVISNALGMEEESNQLAKKFYESLPQDSPYKEMLAPYLSKK